jgi:hypothetical protein
MPTSLGISEDALLEPGAVRDRRWSANDCGLDQVSDPAQGACLPDSIEYALWVHQEIVRRRRIVKLGTESIRTSTLGYCTSSNARLLRQFLIRTARFFRLSGRLGLARET